MAYLPVARPAESRLPHAPSLTAAILALFRRIPQRQRKSPEEHLAAQARREAHRRAVDRLWIGRLLF